jgi:hypothetical protein
VDVVASFPADAQAAEAMQPGDRPLDDPAESAQTGAVRLSPFGPCVRPGRGRSRSPPATSPAGSSTAACSAAAGAASPRRQPRGWSQYELATRVCAPVQ